MTSVDKRSVSFAGVTPSCKGINRIFIYLLTYKYTVVILRLTTVYFFKYGGDTLKESTRSRERLARERDILDAAIKLFCENGFDKTSMEDLSKESEYTKKTIYRYFTCKEDLFFAVMLDGYRRLTEMIASSHSPERSGLENIRQAYLAFYNFHIEQPQLLKLMTMEGIIKSYSMNKEAPFREKLDEQTLVMFNEIIGLFAAAKSDGTIREDLDVTKLTFSSIFIATGFFHLFSLSGESFAGFLKIGKDAFADFCIERMLDFLSKGES